MSVCSIVLHVRRSTAGWWSLASVRYSCTRCGESEPDILIDGHLILILRHLFQKRVTHSIAGWACVCVCCYSLRHTLLYILNERVWVVCCYSPKHALLDTLNLSC